MYLGGKKFVVAEMNIQPMLNKQEYMGDDFEYYDRGMSIVTMVLVPDSTYGIKKGDEAVGFCDSLSLAIRVASAHVASLVDFKGEFTFDQQNIHMLVQ